MTADTSPRTQNIGHGLLKQRSRRLLGNVIRRKMLVDNKNGYNDELQYNIALRGPNYNGKEEDIADALEKLKAMQQKILRANAHVTKTKPAFIPSVVFTSTKRIGEKDSNANFISATKSDKSKMVNGRTSTHQSFKVRSDCPKTTARSAISNALFQSINFKQFMEKSDPRSDKEIVNVPQRAKPSKAKVQSVPVPAIAEKTIRLNTRADRNRNLSTHNHVSTTNPADTRNGRQKKDYHPPHSVSEPVQRNGVKRSYQKQPEMKQFKTGQHNRKELSLVKVKQPDLMTTRPSASQFRIKAISISGHHKEPVSEPKRSQNFVSGLSVYRQSPIATLTVNLASQSGQKIQKSAKDEHKISGEKQKVEVGSSNTQKPTVSRKSHVISFTTTINNLNGIDSAPNRPVDCSNLAPGVSNYIHHPPAPSSKPKKELEKVTSPNKEKVPSLKKCEIPRFYFPKGKPRPKDELEKTLARISEVCSQFKDRMVPINEMGHIAKACNVSTYWKGPIFHVAVGKPNATLASEENIKREWKRIATASNDPSSRFVSLLAKPGKNCLDFEDFLPLLKDIVDSHPGLIFLKDAPEFHTRYMNTVIARIFYAVNRSWSGQITASELRKSNFLTVLSLLEEEDDINAITDYFSYEHFYVIYCKFWELDSDHDLVIDQHDLVSYGDGVLSSRLIDRVLSGAVTRWDTSDHHLEKMSYVDFVWFILSEEDKKTQTSIEYWFRCMDLDGDGYISMYEMEYFYEEQSQKLEQLDIEPLPFEDCVCQAFDIVNPKESGKVSLGDLKKCKMAHVFYDTFFNVAKYLNNEQKDPFVATDGTTPVESDWDSFAAEEYELLVAEEQTSKVPDVSNSILEEERVDLLDDHQPTATYNSLVQSISKSPEEGIPSESQALISLSKA